MNLCVIPARGGSKRIPKKNIKEFCGKPLITYSIEVALKSKLFDKIVISTDDETIAQVASVYNDVEVQIRPKELSDDYTGTMDVFEYVLEQNPGFDYACMIYATAPFLQEKYLKEGYEKLKNSNACFSFSATSFSFPIQRAFKLKDGRCEMFEKENFSKRSQDLDEAYHDAGQFYWQKVGCQSKDVLFGKDSIPIILPRYLVQDIDTMEDFTRAEYMYKAIIEAKNNDNISR
ncbi:MAG: pseudaminic acid cytidylyltransferase [Epsilonproteobacteria bacterium]|nr:pseudaminic acid cytidylyltransferase [Campylobacterota bacterium]